MAYTQAGLPTLGVPTADDDIDMLSDAGISYAESIRDRDLDMLGSTAGDIDYMIEDAASTNATAGHHHHTDHSHSFTGDFDITDSTAERPTDGDDLNEELLDDPDENVVSNINAYRITESSETLQATSPSTNLQHPSDPQVIGTDSSHEIHQSNQQTVRDGGPAATEDEGEEQYQGKPEINAAPRQSPSDVPTPTKNQYSDSDPTDYAPHNLAAPWEFQAPPSTSVTMVQTATPQESAETAPYNTLVPLDEAFASHAGLDEPGLSQFGQQPQNVAANPAAETSYSHASPHTDHISHEDDNSDGATLATGEDVEAATELSPRRSIPTVLMKYEDFDLVSLFPPSTEYESLKQFAHYTSAIEDGGVAYESIGSVFTALRQRLTSNIDHEHELCLSLPQLGLQIYEGSVDCTGCTFEEISSLFHTLNFNDGIEEHQPLKVHLIARQRFSERLNTLHRAVKEQKGLSELHFTQADFAWEEERSVEDESGVQDDSGDVESGSVASGDGSAGQTAASEDHSVDRTAVSEEDSANHESYEEEEEEVEEVVERAGEAVGSVDESAEEGTLEELEHLPFDEHDEHSTELAGFPDAANEQFDPERNHQEQLDDFGAFGDDLEELGQSTAETGHGEPDGQAQAAVAIENEVHGFEVGYNDEFAELIDQQDELYDDEYGDNSAEDVDTGSTTIEGDYGNENENHEAPPTTDEVRPVDVEAAPEANDILNPERHGSERVAHDNDNGAFVDDFNIDWTVEDYEKGPTAPNTGWEDARAGGNVGLETDSLDPVEAATAVETPADHLDADTVKNDTNLRSLSGDAAKAASTVGEAIREKLDPTGGPDDDKYSMPSFDRFKTGRSTSPPGQKRSRGEAEDPEEQDPKRVRKT